jgi:hydrogenase maturation factor HypF (carbamoyltransferase family)
MIRLLGDMRAYNYVIVPIHDFDQVVFKIRPIDFDQQCYEGNLKVYRPQFFKENYPMVKLVKDKLETSSIEQYKNEERAALAKRIFTNETRVNKLLHIMGNDDLAPDTHVEQLKMELYRLTHDINFKRAKSMGNVLDSAFDFVTRNYKNVFIIN